MAFNGLVRILRRKDVAIAFSVARGDNARATLAIVGRPGSKARLNAYIRWYAKQKKAEVSAFRNIL